MITKNTLSSMAIFIICQVFLQFKLFTPIGLLISIIFLTINFLTIQYFVQKIISNNTFHSIRNVLSNDIIYFLLFFSFVLLYNSFPSSKINVYYSYILLQLVLINLTNLPYLKERSWFQNKRIFALIFSTTALILKIFLTNIC